LRIKKVALAPVLLGVLPAEAVGSAEACSLVG
jgi:hypothetical protein